MNPHSSTATHTHTHSYLSSLLYWFNRIVRIMKPHTTAIDTCRELGFIHFLLFIRTYYVHTFNVSEYFRGMLAYVWINNAFPATNIFRYFHTLLQKNSRMQNKKNLIWNSHALETLNKHPHKLITTTTTIRCRIKNIL